MAFKEVPANCEYINHVSVFRDQQESVEQMLLAVSKVETPYYFFGDDDDPTPKVVPTPSGDNGIVYGDMLTQVAVSVSRRKMGPWDAERHLMNPFFVHKAVCRTDYTLLLATLAPTEKMWFEFLYHYLLAYCFGAEYNPEYEYLWQKHVTGMHTTHPPMTSTTRRWLVENRDRIKELVKR